ncbi:MAG: hypothetical protein R3C12_19390 [Planctomycetaceae bacterium]
MATAVVPASLGGRRPCHLEVQYDTIAFESTLDDITAGQLTRLTLAEDLTGLGGLTVAGTTRFATASARRSTAGYQAVVLEVIWNLTASGTL